MLSDSLALASIGKETNFFRMTNYIGNFSTYIFSYVLIMCFSNYITTYISTRKIIKHTAVNLVYIVSSIGIILAFISLFNNMYFIID